MDSPAVSENLKERKKDRRQTNATISFEDRRFLDRRQLEANFRKGTVVPRFPDNYSALAIGGRLQWLQERVKQDLSLFGTGVLDPRALSKNVENCIGATQVPLGIAGPLLVKGRSARGSFYIPLATTQGTLVEAYHRGSLITNMAGGVTSVAYKDGVHISPSFIFKDLHESLKFMTWVRENERLIKTTAEQTTTHGKLLRATPFLLGRIVLLNLLFTTGDASGLNMINIASDAVCKMVMDKVGPERYFLRSNFSSDKKPSYLNFIMGYGKEVLAELTLSKTLIKRFMRTTPQDMFAFWYQAFIASVQAGMLGPNAHFANGLSAMFIACGQDIAQVVNASTGILTLEVLPSGDLRIYCKFPQMIVATVGGGTTLPFPKACLQLLGCYGEGKVMKLAEIMAAAALAGEVSIVGALASGEFAEADLALRARTK